MSKKLNIARPNRDPDHYSKRRVPYWWAPEWVRGTSSDTIYPPNSKFGAGIMNLLHNAGGDIVVPCDSYGKIHAIKVSNDVLLHMKSKEGKLSYIQGSIQKEFKRWHEDRSIDYLLLGMDPDEIIAQDD
jgi:hypothetical protein